MSPVVASTLLANVRRPEWLEPPFMPARWYSHGHMGLQAVAGLVVPLLSSLKNSTLGVLRHAIPPAAVDQRLVRQQGPVWPRAEQGPDPPLDAVHQVGLQGLDGGLGSQIGASLAAALGDGLAQADLAAQLA